uniref:Zinc carboxypeptidase A 1 n=1 Tax=Acrobeloides nanus TaxID=290746 RepID=A0A914C7V0_9BILA
MKWGPLAFLVLSLLIKSHALSNKNNRTETFKVFRVYPQSWQHIETLAEIRKISEEENEIDFWLDSRQPGQFADIMVAPRAQSYFMDLLMKHDLQFKTTIDDVEKMIYENEHHIKNDDKPHVLDENYENLMHYENFRFRKRLKDEPSKFGDRPFEKVGQARANYPFGQYTDYATMVRYMRTIEFYYPHIAKLIRIGTSHEGQPIEGLKLGYHVSNTSKPGFWIDGNIHAREWASSHTALFIINQLVSGYGKDPVVTYYMNKMNFFIIPCLNPDGYEYSRSSAWPEIRLWRKNRSPERCAPSRWGGIRCCSGVDLNRNFDFHWSESGANHHPCSNEYVGESPFSEPESR